MIQSLLKLSPLTLNYRLWSSLWVLVFALPEFAPPLHGQANEIDGELLQVEFDYRGKVLDELMKLDDRRRTISSTIEAKVAAMEAEELIGETLALKLRVLGRRVVSSHVEEIRSLQLSDDIAHWQISKRGLIPIFEDRLELPGDYEESYLRVSGSAEEVIANDPLWSRSLKKMLDETQYQSFLDRERERRHASMREVLRSLLRNYGAPFTLDPKQTKELVSFLVESLPAKLGDANDYEMKTEIIRQLQDSPALEKGFLAICQQPLSGVWANAWAKAATEDPAIHLNQILGR